jgi:hypothetical protein
MPPLTRERTPLVQVSQESPSMTFPQYCLLLWKEIPFWGKLVVGFLIMCAILKAVSA